MAAEDARGPADRTPTVEGEWVQQATALIAGYTHEGRQWDADVWSGVLDRAQRLEGSIWYIAEYAIDEGVRDYARELLAALSRPEPVECPDCSKYMGKCPKCHRPRPRPGEPGGDQGARAVPGRADSLDAARWRALMRCGRIKMQGSAGVDPHTGERRNGSNVHFGAEFWPERLPDDYRAKHPEEAANYDRSTRWGVACLTALADAIIELSPTPAGVCQMCEGRGEIGGFVGGAAPGWETHPCPECSSQTRGAR